MTTSLEYDLFARWHVEMVFPGFQNRPLSWRYLK
jgi:hypothetical protein